jgi:hypothetical protein
VRRILLLTLLLAGCSTAPVDRIEPATSMLLLPGEGEQAVIAVTAYDAEGEELPEATLEWRSEDPSVVEVTADAVVGRAIGWTRLVATSDEVESEPVLVYVAEPVAGAVLFGRANVLSLPELVGESPESILGARLELRLQEITVQEGDLLIPTDDVEAAGRVVSVDASSAGTDVVLEVVPPNELFTELKIDTHAELAWDEAVWPGNAWGTVTYGPFECEATSNTEIAGLTFTKTITPSLSSDSTLEVHLGDTTTATLLVKGTIDIELFAGLELPDTYDGTIVCEATILSPSIPVTVGWLKLLLNIEVPIGVGIELQAEVTGAGVQVGVRGTDTVTLAAGFHYDSVTGFETEGYNELDLGTPVIEPVFDIPEVDDLRLDASVWGYAFAEIKAGPVVPIFQLVKARVGPKLSASIATPENQAADPAYASSYGMDLEGEIGAGSDILELLHALGVPEDVDLTWNGTLDLADSPTGGLTLEPDLVEAYTPVQATVTLEPSHLDFLGMHNVDGVLIYRIEDDDLELMVEIEPESDTQTEFAWTWTPTEADEEQLPEFVAFVRTSLLPIVPLEVRPDSGRSATVGGTSLILCVTDVVAPTDSATDSIDADVAIEDYMNTLEAYYIYMQGQADYWTDMSLVYASTGDWVNMVNAIELAEVWGVEAGQMAGQTVHWAKLHAALANVGDGPARFTGGAESNDYTAGGLRDLSGNYEIGWEDPSFSSSWDTLPETSATHSFIVAPSFDGDPMYLLMFSTKALGIADESDPEAVVLYEPDILATDFMYIAPYMMESTSTVYVDGEPWSSMDHMVSTPDQVVEAMAFGEPHTMLVTMDVEVIDSSQFPSWADTTVLPMDLFSFDFTLELGSDEDTSVFLDDDGDGYGDPEIGVTVCELASMDPDEAARYVSNGLDCDDADEQVNPGAGEVCNDVDDDCDDEIDEEPLDGLPWHGDADGDGFGDLLDVVIACDPPEGYVDDDTDCDDADAAINPLELESCNGIDDDCDTLVDDDDPDALASMYFADLDGDGYGDPGNHVVACLPPDSYGEDDTDCDDLDAAIHPDAVEVCNLVDDNCDGLVDGDDPLVVGASTWYGDGDGDGFTGSQDVQVACDEPTGPAPSYAEVDGGDCDDLDASVAPGAPEAWYDSVDSDCDGAVNPDPCDVAPPAGQTLINPTCLSVDLELQAWAPCQAACGADVTVFAQVGNSGSDASSAGPLLSLYGEDASANRTLLDQVALDSVASGDQTAAIDFVVASADLAGYAQLVVVVDDGNAQAECDEGNAEEAIDLSAICD